MTDLGYQEATGSMSRRLQRTLPWVAGLVLLAGVIVALVKLVPNQNPKADTSVTKNPVRVSPNAPPTVKLPQEARDIAGKFILTAVVRKNLADAWKISGAGIRQTLTRKEFLTGNIPVVPFPFKLAIAPMKVDYSFKNQALLEVALIAPKKARVKPQYFYLGLKRVGAAKPHWVVDSWVPRVGPKIPANPVG